MGENLRDFPMSGFMHDLCNGLYVQLQRYRQGDDFSHFRFVGSIYPKHNIELGVALELARGVSGPRRALLWHNTVSFAPMSRLRQIRQSIRQWLALPQCLYSHERQITCQTNRKKC